MKIGQVAKLCGINTSTIRFYERQGLISPQSVERSTNGYRVYGPNEIETIFQILRFKELGLELSEIRVLIQGEKVCGDLRSSIDSQLTKYHSALKTIENRINLLTMAKINCETNCSTNSSVKNCC